MAGRTAKTLTIYTDGGSRGNPGPAAGGFVIQDKNGRTLTGKAVYLDETTNNVAEYTGLIRALQAAEPFEPAEIKIFSDSELMVRQLNGAYKVKSPKIKPLYQEAIALLGRFDRWSLKHVMREHNTIADGLVNEAMDRKKDIEMKKQAQANTKKIRLGVLLSGGGRTLLNILDQVEAGILNAEVPLVISSRSTVKGVERAKNAGLDVVVIRKKDYPDIDAFSEALASALDEAKVDLVIQAGWLCLWKIPPQYENRVMNIHPALLPSFGGQGMWGHHVHEAVLAAGCKVSGCTVHFCTNEYDKGPIIVQRCCPVAENDDADTLAARVFEQECIAYPDAIRLFADNKLQVEQNRVNILP